MKKTRNIKSQSWAIKTKGKEWENTSVTAYRREALCWPLGPSGQINEDYKWPLEGELISGFVHDSRENSASTQMITTEDKPRDRKLTCRRLMIRCAQQVKQFL